MAIRLPVFEIIRRSQQDHGFRHSTDYGQYHAYCSRRLTRLRRLAGLSHRGGHGRVGGAKFAPRSNAGSSRQQCEVMLYESERCWAQGMALRDVAETRSADGQAGNKAAAHAARRLRKSIHHAERLAAALAAAGDALSKAEGAAYKQYVRGMALSALGGRMAGNAQEALVALHEARFLLQELGLYDKIIEALIEPLIRFAMFTLQQSKKQSAASVAAESLGHDAMRKKFASLLGPLKQPGHAGVSAPELDTASVDADIVRRLQSLSVSTMAPNQVVSACRGLLSDLGAARAQQTVVQKAKRDALHVQVERRIKTDLVRFEQMDSAYSKAVPALLARRLELCPSFDQKLTMAWAFDAESADTGDKRLRKQLADLTVEAAGLVRPFAGSSWSCRMLLGKLLAEEALLVGNFASAAAMLEAVVQQAAAAGVDPQSTSSLETLLAVARTNYFIQQHMDQLPTGKSAAVSEAAVTTQDVLAALPAVTVPDFVPMPAKPVFYDVAGQFVAYPDLSDLVRSASKAGSQAPPSSGGGGGLFGLFRRS